MFEFVSDSEMVQFRGMLDDLMKVGSGLSEWELDFLDGEEGLMKWEGRFSKKQVTKLEEIYQRLC